MVYNVYSELPTYLAVQDDNREICEGAKIMFASSDYQRAAIASAGELPAAFIAAGLLMSRLGRRR